MQFNKLNINMNCKSNDNLPSEWILVGPNCKNVVLCTNNTAYVPAVTVCNQELFKNSVIVNNQKKLKSPTASIIAQDYGTNQFLKYKINFVNQDSRTTSILIYRNTTNNFKTATLIATKSVNNTSHEDLLSSGGWGEKYYYYIKATNGVLSSKIKYLGEYEEFFTNQPIRNLQSDFSTDDPGNTLFGSVTWDKPIQIGTLRYKINVYSGDLPILENLVSTSYINSSANSVSASITTFSTIIDANEDYYVEVINVTSGGVDSSSIGESGVVQEV